MADQDGGVKMLLNDNPLQQRTAPSSSPLISGRRGFCLTFFDTARTFSRQESN